MKRILLLLAVICCFDSFAAQPDSAYVFAYSTAKNNNKNGLHFAWSVDKENWNAIGPEHAYVKSDYGNWGSEKRMLEPVMFKSSDGAWVCVWRLNEKGHTAKVSTKDMVYWGRQTYYATDSELKDKLSIDRQQAIVSGKTEKGSILKVEWGIVDGLIKAQQLSAYKALQWGETTAQDAERFAGLKPVEINIKPKVAKSKAISDLLVGIFFEDINYAADGGLYAELVQNRDFEYETGDTKNRDAAWNSKKAWTGEFSIDTIAPIHPNNPHYAVVSGGKISNEGFAGIPIKKGEKYNLSLFARSPKGTNIEVSLSDKTGKIYGQASIKASSSKWRKYEAVIVASQTIANTQLELTLSAAANLDMISLFPQNTFKGRKNGLRADLAQTIADMKPRFVRFPGGCLAHGDGLENMYLWQTTVGPLEARKPMRNIWNYHQTTGLGYYEYFTFCEDIGALPLPVVAAGVPCQNSASHGHSLGGQQGGIPMCDMDDYVQDVLNLIEWANGDKKTKWGKVRADAGHPEPFNLKYIGVGNEDIISDIFEERFEMIYKAIKEKHPEIVVIGTAGPFFEGTDYTEGWAIADKLGVPMMDEHYYVSPGWMIHNQDYYDKYDRKKGKVYLGEYAAHMAGRPSNLEVALAEAIYMTSLERNGDVVSMASYAPLLAKDGYTQWRPDLIYFTNTEVKPTPSYQVQKLFGQNAGGDYIPQTISYSSDREDVRKRIAVSVVKDSNNDVIVKMVNMLPVEVDPTLDLSEVNVSEVSKTVLTGAPSSRSAKPIESKGIENLKLEPYSLTILRIKTK